MCPIGYTIMIDPVIASDGITYEKENIINWAQTQLDNLQAPTSPVMPGTYLEMTMSADGRRSARDHLFLIPNINLRKIIEDNYEYLIVNKHDLVLDDYNNNS